MIERLNAFKPLSGGGIKAKRYEAGISGHALGQRLGKSRSWLTTVERDYYVPPATEFALINRALNELITAKLQRTAAALGWPEVEAQ